MDEILATIRRIIAEDEQSIAGPTAGGAAGKTGPGTSSTTAIGPAATGLTAPGDGLGAGAATASSDAADDVLELTDALNEDGSVRRLAPIGSPSYGNRMIEPPPLAERIEPSPNPEPGPEPKPELKPEPEPDPDLWRRPLPSRPPLEPAAADDERLVSEVTSLATAAALARLAAAPRGRVEAPRVGDRPLEDMVRELLRPLLQTWLDENLPPIVERLVDAEIARIAGKSGPA